ncbi:hypothetical protein K505DRAFT_390614 [Melanomma pulvis-pyrius CBS 109.77]|uniref:Uncharacterized protein n=1 Tax=Melanomma pulvis-pyrius CBS 109.77 TaxID=1314802 RepID=A0A6A6X2Y6_9PLEO|nr:hypothetical protein K505DRAFT_390614 [Melanomma pulvis-pyrius CBS 109.77]
MDPLATIWIIAILFIILYHSNRKAIADERTARLAQKISKAYKEHCANRDTATKLREFELALAEKEQRIEQDRLDYGSSLATSKAQVARLTGENEALKNRVEDAETERERLRVALAAAMVQQPRNDSGSLDTTEETMAKGNGGNADLKSKLEAFLIELKALQLALGSVQLSLTKADSKIADLKSKFFQNPATSENGKPEKLKDLKTEHNDAITAGQAKDSRIENNNFDAGQTKDTLSKALVTGRDTAAAVSKVPSDAEHEQIRALKNERNDAKSDSQSKDGEIVETNSAANFDSESKDGEIEKRKVLVMHFENDYSATLSKTKRNVVETEGTRDIQLKAALEAETTATRNLERIQAQEVIKQKLVDDNLAESVLREKDLQAQLDDAKKCLNDFEKSKLQAAPVQEEETHKEIERLKAELKELHDSYEAQSVALGSLYTIHNGWQGSDEHPAVQGCEAKLAEATARANQLEDSVYAQDYELMQLEEAKHEAEEKLQKKSKEVEQLFKQLQKVAAEANQSKPTVEGGEGFSKSKEIAVLQEALELKNKEVEQLVSESQKASAQVAQVQPSVDGKEDGSNDKEIAELRRTLEVRTRQLKSQESMHDLQLGRLQKSEAKFTDATDAQAKFYRVLEDIVVTFGKKRHGTDLEIDRRWKDVKTKFKYEHDVDGRPLLPGRIHIEEIRNSVYFDESLKWLQQLSKQAVERYPYIKDIGTNLTILPSQKNTAVAETHVLPSLAAVPYAQSPTQTEKPTQTFPLNTTLNPTPTPVTAAPITQDLAQATDRRSQTPKADKNSNSGHQKQPVQTRVPPRGGLFQGSLTKLTQQTYTTQSLVTPSTPASGLKGGTWEETCPCGRQWSVDDFGFDASRALEVHKAQCKVAIVARKDAEESAKGSTNDQMSETSQGTEPPKTVRKKGDPIICNQCGAIFHCSMSEFKRTHLQECKKKHPGALSSPRGKPVICGNCHREFDRGAFYTIHKNECTRDNPMSPGASMDDSEAQQPSSRGRPEKCSNCFEEFPSHDILVRDHLPVCPARPEQSPKPRVMTCKYCNAEILSPSREWFLEHHLSKCPEKPQHLTECINCHEQVPSIRAHLPVCTKRLPRPNLSQTSSWSQPSTPPFVNSLISPGQGPNAGQGASSLLLPPPLNIGASVFQMRSNRASTSSSPLSGGARAFSPGASPFIPRTGTPNSGRSMLSQTLQHASTTGTWTRPLTNTANSQNNTLGGTLQHASTTGTSTRLPTNTANSQNNTLGGTLQQRGLLSSHPYNSSPAHDAAPHGQNYQQPANPQTNTTPVLAHANWQTNTPGGAAQTKPKEKKTGGLMGESPYEDKDT